MSSPDLRQLKANVGCLSTTNPEHCLTMTGVPTEWGYLVGVFPHQLPLFPVRGKIRVFQG